MKYLAIIITVLGILSLSLILFLQKPSYINSPEQLSSLIENQQIITQGQVMEERYLSNSKIIALNNDIEIIVDKSIPYLINKNITVLGVYDNFLKPRIKALKINVQNDI
jgi:hypothetical protein